MGFIYQNAHIDFQDFNKLRSYDIAFLSDLADLCDTWYNEEVETISLTSSGTSSTPKTITHSKESMRQSAQKTQAYFDYKKGDTALLCLPVHFIGGMMMVVRSIVSELNLILLEPGSRPLKTLASKVDFLPMTPHQLVLSIQHDKHKLGLVKNILLGGAPVSSELHQSIKDLAPDVYLGFGMTETISHIAVKRLNGPNESEVFTALHGVSLSIDSNDCLLISADHLKEEIATKDVVDVESASQFKWKGRLDNVINSGGIKLYPELIENKLKPLIQFPFFVAGIEDVNFGTIVCLIIESTDDLDLEKEKVKQVLDNYEVPKQIYYVEEFKRTETGKLKRSLVLEHIYSNNIIPEGFK